MDRTYNLSEFPDDFISFEELSEEYPDITGSDWKRLALSVDIPVQRFRLATGTSHRRALYGINWNEVEKLERAYFPERFIDQETGVPIEPVVESSTVDDEIIPPRAGNDIISAFKLARELHVRMSTLLGLADKHKIKHSRYLFTNKSRGEGFHIDFREQLKNLAISEGLTDFDEIARRDALENAPKNAESIKHCARSRYMTEATLWKLCEGAKIVPAELLVKGVPTFCLTQDQIKDLEIAYDPKLMKRVVPISIREFARQNRSNVAEMVALCKSAKIKLKTYSFSNKENLGITPDQVLELEKAYKGLPRAPFSTDDVLAFGPAAREEGIDYRTMRKLVRGTSIHIRKYRFPNGKDLDGISIGQMNTLKLAYAAFEEPTQNVASGIVR